ncbi:MAG TPA: ABC transporter substrate-binding protein [Solirubrobacteraceae bacterium]|jgi:peptide/nickel transport system substrate-binding protein|nr:ABC transporter substrate-binding protein [Solirubrobacteraceae bacterium]
MNVFRALESLLEGPPLDPITRRQLLRRAGAGAGAFGAAGLLAACGSSSSKPATTAAGKPGGMLKVGADADAYVLSGSGANVGQYPLNANIFEGLVRMDAQYGIVPVLATSWTLRPGNTWRFTLRRGVKFHDGQPFTAKAVKYSFDVIATKGGGGTPGFAKHGTVVVDDYTVDVTPSFPNARLVEQIVHPENYIIAPGSDPVKHPTGTGPFSFASYQHQQSLVVKRFAGYWGKPALLDGITFSFIPDSNARLLALESGSIDVMLIVPSQDAADLKSKGFTVGVSPVGAYEAFYCNIGGKKGYTICQDSGVRKAIEMAIDRAALIKAIYAGEAAAEQTMIPTRLLGANAATITGYTYDPAKAKQLLDSAGWTVGAGGTRSKGGKPLSLQLIDGFPSPDSHTGVPEFVQAQLKQVGIDVKIIVTPDNASYTARMNALQGDLWLEQGNQNDANPSFLPALLFSKKGLFGGSAYQTMFAPGGSVDTLINEALATPSEATVKSAVAQAMHVLIDEDAIVVPLAGIPRIVATTSKVRGFDNEPSQLQVRYDGVSLA